MELIYRLALLLALFFLVLRTPKKNYVVDLLSQSKREKKLDLFFFCVRFFWFYSLEKSLKVIIMQSIHNTCTMRHVFQTFKSFFFVRSFVVDS